LPDRATRRSHRAGLQILSSDATAQKNDSALAQLDSILRSLGAQNGVVRRVVIVEALVIGLVIVIAVTVSTLPVQNAARLTIRDAIAHK